MNIFKTDVGVALMASQAIQPFETSATLSKLSVLSFYKELTPDVLDTLATEHGLEGLRLTPTPASGLLSAPIKDMKGTVIAYLVWPSHAPGTAVFSEVFPYIVAATAILVLFLAGVLMAGAFEARRLHQLAEAARFEASHDSLSGLLNRHGVLNVLEQLDSPAPAASLYLIDLDGFKAVNDAWGHAVGDELIRMVAKGLQTCHQEVYAAARLGGDEFALVQVGSAARQEIEQSVLTLFEEPFKIGGRTIEVGASIGVAARIGGIKPLELLRRADMALYRAKENGRGQAIAFDPELDRERQRIAELEGELRSAIDSGTIQPVFQPSSLPRPVPSSVWRHWHAGGTQPEPSVPKCSSRLRKNPVSSKHWASTCCGRRSLTQRVGPVWLCRSTSHQSSFAIRSSPHR